MPEAVGICHGHRPSHGAEPQVGQRSLFDDTPNLLCVSELHVNRQRVIEGAILSFLDTAFASQASTDTCWNRQLSPSQQGVEGNAGNKRARSKVSHSAFCHRCPCGNRPKWEIPRMGWAPSHTYCTAQSFHPSHPLGRLSLPLTAWNL